MANTRIVTGPINTFLDDNPWDGFEVHIKLTPAVYGSTATYPERTEVVHTDADGDFAIELVTGAQYQFLLVGAFTVQGRRTVYGDRNIVTTVVPHGSTPISLATCVAMAADPDADPDLAALANAHLGRVDNPHSVTAAQTGAYTIGQVDSLLADKADDSALAPVAKSGAGSDLTNDVPFLIGADIAHFVPDSRTINGHDLTGDVTLTKADVGLGNADNTSDADKPLSTAAINALALKTDDATLAAIAKTGSADDLADGASNVAMKTGERSKLAGIAAGAEVNVQADWDAASGDAAILHKPTLGTAAATDASDYATAAQGAKADTAIQSAGASRIHQVVSWDGTAPVWRDVLGGIVPDLVAGPHGAYTPSGLVTVTPSASVEVREGGWWLCEGTANLIVPPLVPFGVAGSIPAGSADTSVTPDGSAATKYVNTNSGAYRRSATPVVSNISAGDPVAVSGWLRVSNPLTPMQLIGYTRKGDNSGTTPAIDSGYATQPANQWVRIAKTGVAPPDTTKVELWLWVNTPRADGDLIWLWQPQVEKKPYPTPFVGGTRVDGSIAIPCPTKPGAILLRYDEYGWTQTVRLTLDGSNKATFGTYGDVAWASGVLTISTTKDTGTRANMLTVYGVACWTNPASVPTGPAYDALLHYSGPYTMPIIPAYYAPTPLPQTIMGYFPANAKIAAGGATLRVAPGAATQAVATLAAADLVHDTGKAINDSGTDYQFVQTEWGGGYVAQSKLTSL